MYFLNLSAAELLALFGVLSGVVTALYLLDRTKRRQTVPTLRFWAEAMKPTETRRRRRIRQPLSLILQVLAILFLLLAVAQLRWGSAEESARDHVIVLDTSAWMGARATNGRLLMDEARNLALSYLRALPSGDNVMLLRADALTTPVTAFESNHNIVTTAIRESRAGAGALRLDDALRFARRIQMQRAGRPGEIAFIGSGRTTESDTERTDIPNLRVLLVDSQVENTGLRKVSLRPSSADGSSWQAYVSLRNYGSSAQAVELGLQLAGSPAGSRKLRLPPMGEAEVTLPFRTRSSGVLDVRLFPGDNFPDDDRVLLELPARRTVAVSVYSNRPELLRPLLQASPFVQAVYHRPSEYKPDPAAGIVIFDGFRPTGPAPANSIYIEAPAAGSPVPVKTVVQKAALRQWHSDHTIGSGLRTSDLELDSAQVFGSAPGFEPVADVAEGPVILASSGSNPGSGHSVILGFHPMRSSMRYEVAAPLLFANIIRWMDPGIFRRWELTAESVGTVELRLDSNVARSDVRVVADDGKALPVTLHGRTLRFFSGVPGVVRVMTPESEVVYSLRLPDFAAAAWTPPASAAKGLPARSDRLPTFRELWQWLAILGGILLLIDWIWFGRFRNTRRADPLVRGRAPARPVTEDAVTEAKV